MTDEIRKTPIEGAVQYGSEQSIHAGVGQGRDEEPRTGDGDVPAVRVGRSTPAVKDNFVSSDVQEKARTTRPTS